MTNFTRTLPLTGTTTNAKVWLVFGALSGNNETALDDLALAINTTYVPPVPVPVDYATMQVIANDDSAAVIAEKAAKVLPRANQTAWMRLERTFFLHFGVNTFNGVEWGSGREDPSDIQSQGTRCQPMDERDAKCRRQDGRPRLQTPRWILPLADPLHAALGRGKSVAWRQGRRGREVASAAQAHGIKLGVYLSPADLYQLRTNPKNPGGYYGDGSSNVPFVIPTDPASFKSNPTAGRTPPVGFTSYTYEVDDYNRYFLNQLYELLTEYGPVEEVWFDGANPNPSVQRNLCLFGLVRSDPPSSTPCGHLWQGARRALGGQRERRRPPHRMERHATAPVARHLHLAGHDRARSWQPCQTHAGFVSLVVSRRK